MQENTRNYIELVDELRREYNFTVEKLCSGIITTRYYRRILCGEKNINHGLISKFCDKFEISDSDFYYHASVRDRTELKKIYSLYNMIYTHDYSNFSKSVNLINTKRFLSKQNEKFFRYCIQKAYYVHKKIVVNDILVNLYALFNYPEDLKREIFDFVDIVILLLIAEIQVKFKEDTALQKLIIILENRKAFIVNSESSHISATVYANTSLFLLRLKRYSDAINIATEGLDYSKKHNDVSSLAHLHYSRSYSNYQLGSRKESEIDALRCMSCSIAKNNKTEFDVFHKEFKALFNSNPFDLFKKHQEHLF